MINEYEYKVSHPDVFKQLAVKDMLVAFYRCPQVDKLLNIFSNYNQISFTLSGKKTLRHREKSCTLTADICVFIRKTAYQAEKYEFEGWEVLAFFFNDDFLRQVIREYRQYLPAFNLASTSDMLIEVNVNETTRAFFYGMIPYFSQKIPPSEHLLELKFKELLFNVLADPDNAMLRSYIQSIEDQQKTPIWQVMEANFTFNLSIAELACIAHRSVATFNREFQQYYNTSPGKWLTARRLEHARTLLDASKSAISEIAYSSGFENVTHFSRTFKEKYSMSPLQYRVQHKQVSKE